MPLQQLDEALDPWRSLSPVRPGRGWLRAIRRTLGMTTRQAAGRVGVSQAAVVDAERNEASGDISLTTLQRYAAALDCRLYYALVPNRPLQETLEGRAEALARSLAESAPETGASDAPADPQQAERLVQELRQQLLAGRRSRLWQRAA
jgi:predicted DNA-binding mobile mystery protein A